MYINFEWSRHLEEEPQYNEVRSDTNLGIDFFFFFFFSKICKILTNLRQCYETGPGSPSALPCRLRHATSHRRTQTQLGDIDEVLWQISHY